MFEIDPTRNDIDHWTWVVSGDLPSAYISPEFASNPDEAIHCYIEEMQAWVDAVKRGEAVDDLIPVDAEATFENADQLDRRLRFLRDKVLSEDA